MRDRVTEKLNSHNHHKLVIIKVICEDNNALWSFIVMHQAFDTVVTMRLPNWDNKANKDKKEI